MISKYHLYTKLTEPYWVKQLPPTHSTNYQHTQYSAIASVQNLLFSRLPVFPNFSHCSFIRSFNKHKSALLLKMGSLVLLHAARLSFLSFSPLHTSTPSLKQLNPSWLLKQAKHNLQGSIFARFSPVPMRSLVGLPAWLHKGFCPLPR